MTRSEIIELSNSLTERKGERVLSLQSLYRIVVQDIAKRKLNDLNARDVEHASRIIEGTARSMGLTVEK